MHSTPPRHLFRHVQRAMLFLAVKVLKQAVARRCGAQSCSAACDTRDLRASSKPYRKSHRRTLACGSEWQVGSDARTVKPLHSEREACLPLTSLSLALRSTGASVYLLCTPHSVWSLCGMSQARRRIATVTILQKESRIVPRVVMLAAESKNRSWSVLLRLPHLTSYLPH